MAPRYLANSEEAWVLNSLQAFDPTSLDALREPLLLIDARADALAFKLIHNATLVSVISAKWAAGRLLYVSELGSKMRDYAMDQLTSRHAKLDIATRKSAEESLLRWRKERATRGLFEGDFDHASGIGIVLPVSGARLHYDFALAATVAS